MKTILVTRPIDYVDETCALVEAAGYSALSAPMLMAESVEKIESLPKKYTGIILTSRRSVDYLATLKGQLDLDKPAYCVGNKTASAARDFGFRNIIAGIGGSAELAEIILKNEKKKAAFIHFGGMHINTDMYDVLSDVHISVQHIPVYTMKRVQVFEEKVLKALEAGTISAVMFFSARTAVNFNRLVIENGLEKNLKRICAICISDKLTSVLDNDQWGKIIFADEPSEFGMISAVSNL